MSTDTVGYGSHFNIEKWTKFIECELNGLSHRKTADIVGIHRNTALLWRHKLYNALDYLKEKIKRSYLNRCQEYLNQFQRAKKSTKAT